MDQTTKDRVKQHLQSIAILAVNTQQAMDDEDLEEAADLLESIDHDIDMIRKIGRELLEQE
jgi:hypothetical protein